MSFNFIFVFSAIAWLDYGNEMLIVDPIIMLYIELEFFCITVILKDETSGSSTRGSWVVGSWNSSCHDTGKQKAWVRVPLTSHSELFSLL